MITNNLKSAKDKQVSVQLFSLNNVEHRFLQIHEVKHTAMVIMCLQHKGQEPRQCLHQSLSQKRRPTASVVTRPKDFNLQVKFSEVKRKH